MFTLLIYIAAAIAEIAGCVAFWFWYREAKSILWLVPGMLSLLLFAWLLSQSPAEYAGRAYAVYGGIYIPTTLGWLWRWKAYAPTVGISLEPPSLSSARPSFCGLHVHNLLTSGPPRDLVFGRIPACHDASFLHLHRRTFYRAIRTEHAAVPSFSPQHRFTLRTFVNLQTCVCRHCFFHSVLAQRARQNRLKQYVCHITPFMAQPTAPPAE